MISPITIEMLEQVDSEIVKQENKTGIYKLKPKAVIFLDIEGYAQIIYQCWNNEENMNKFCNLITDFWRKMERRGHGNSITIINNAGDGFLALSEDPNMKRTHASIFSASLIKEFESSFQEFPKSIPYRFKPRIRVGLHFGEIYIISRKRTQSEFDKIFVGDAINVAARIASTDTARDFQIACSKQFHDRLHKTERKKYERNETYYDLNKYPEPIIIYGYKSEKSTTRDSPIKKSVTGITSGN